MNLSTLDFRLMKRFLLYIAGLLSIVLVAVWMGEVLNRWLVFSSSNSSGYRMKRLFEFASSKGEMPILGSSRAEGNFAPKNISPIAFNYGLRGSHFHETLFQLKVVLSRPLGGVVLVNLDPWGMDDGSYMHDYRFVLDRDLVKSNVKIPVSIVDRFPGLRFYGQLRQNIALCVNLGPTTKVLENGAVLSKIVRTEREWEYMLPNFEVKQYCHEEALEAMLHDILKLNTRWDVVFVVSPVLPQWWSKFVDKDKLRMLMARLAKLDHVHVVDFAMMDNSYSFADFIDPIHLNEKGARRFSDSLRNELKQMGLLQDGGEACRICL